MDKKIEFFTLHCPKCKTLQMLMDKKGIVFNVIDDEEIVRAEGAKYNLNSAPFALINGECYDTKKLQAWIKEQ
jgi:glutaredoxin